MHIRSSECINILCRKYLQNTVAGTDYIQFRFMGWKHMGELQLKCPELYKSHVLVEDHFPFKYYYFQNDP